MPGVNRIGNLLPALAVVGGCAQAPQPYADLPALQVSTRIALANMCAGSQSPPIGLANVPPGTARFRVRLSNLSVLRQQPVEWTIPVSEERTLIPIGALAGYVGPCPGDTQAFTYRFEVLALGAGDRPAGYGMARIRVSSVNALAQETWRRATRSDPIDPTRPPAFDDDGTDVFAVTRGRDDVFGDDRRRERFNDPVLPGIQR